MPWFRDTWLYGYIVQQDSTSIQSKEMESDIIYLQIVQTCDE